MKALRFGSWGALLFVVLPVAVLSLAGFPPGIGLAGAESAETQAEAKKKAPVGPLHPMEVRNPPSLGTIDTGEGDASGGSAGVACSTCHAPGNPTALAEGGEVPKDFHGALELRHGTLRCNSCHAPEDRTKLRLAHGETLPMTEVMQLCGQCHGSQMRDFRKGAHGGGRGYWDRTRGPWIRNSCVACHAAHAPAYPLVMPAPPPNDRFLSRPHESKEPAAHE